MKWTVESSDEYFDRTGDTLINQFSFSLNDTWPEQPWINYKCARKPVQNFCKIQTSVSCKWLIPSQIPLSIVPNFHSKQIEIDLKFGSLLVIIETLQVLTLNKKKYTRVEYHYDKLYIYLLFIHKWCIVINNDNYQ